MGKSQKINCYGNSPNIDILLGIPNGDKSRGAY